MTADVPQRRHEGQDLRSLRPGRDRWGDRVRKLATPRQEGRPSRPGPEDGDDALCGGPFRRDQTGGTRGGARQFVDLPHAWERYDGRGPSLALVALSAIAGVRCPPRRTSAHGTWELLNIERSVREPAAIGNQVWAAGIEAQGGNHLTLLMHHNA